MKNKQLVKYVTIAMMIFVTVVVIGWDIFVATNQVAGDTVSELQIWAGQRFLLLPHAWGTLMGHFWLPWKEDRFTWQVKMIILSSSGLLFLLFDIVSWFNPNPVHAFLGRWPIIVFAFSVVYGGFVCSQANTKK